jgi:hypothetical protein
MAEYEAGNSKFDEEDWTSWSFETVSTSWIFTHFQKQFIYIHKKIIYLNVYYSSCRKLMGEGLGSCSMEELQQIEQQLEKSVSVVRARKVSLTNPLNLSDVNVIFWTLIIIWIPIFYFSESGLQESNWATKKKGMLFI